MPQLLRWTVLGTINDMIGASSEMSILDSADYPRSWWPQGDLLCRSYLDHQVVRLQRFDPEKWRVAEAEEAYRPVVDDPQAARMADMSFDRNPLWIPDFAGVLPPRMPAGTDDEFATEFAPEALAAAVGRRRLPCPGRCGLSFTITRLPPTYLHYHRPVGPDRTHLEPIPTYDARP